MKRHRNPLPEFLRSGKAAYDWLVGNSDKSIVATFEDEFDEEVDSLGEREAITALKQRCVDYSKFAKSAFKFTDGVQLYRALCIESKQDIFWESLGVYWSAMKDHADCYGHPMMNVFDTIFVVEAVVCPDDIDWANGFVAYFANTTEWEVRVLPGVALGVTKLSAVGRERTTTEVFNPPIEANSGPEPE